jgi:hypothetical protein
MGVYQSCSLSATRLDTGTKMPRWSDVWPFAIILAYILVGLLGHHLNMILINGR